MSPNYTSDLLHGKGVAKEDLKAVMGLIDAHTGWASSPIHEFFDPHFRLSSIINGEWNLMDPHAIFLSGVGVTKVVASHIFRDEIVEQIETLGSELISLHLSPSTSCNNPRFSAKVLTDVFERVFRQFLHDIFSASREGTTLEGLVTVLSNRISRTAISGMVVASKTKSYEALLLSREGSSGPTPYKRSQNSSSRSPPLQGKQPGNQICFNFLAGRCTNMQCKRVHRSPKDQKEVDYIRRNGAKFIPPNILQNLTLSK